ncbi:MAG: hybrid sensor histidine kinase/response regulator [Magnetococcus sp. YQC-3]
MSARDESALPAGKSKVLVVDDTPENVKILANALIKQYEVLVSNEGEGALQLAEQELPDLILLDIMMPGMDGYTVCRRLKENATTRNIPVIFITAMGSEVDEVMGLQIGAADYITKPFRIPIVLSRVATHLSLHDSYVQIEQQYAALRALEQARRDVEAIIRHDMRSPIDGMIGCLSLLLRHGNLPEKEVRGFHEMLLDSANQLRAMVNLSLNLVKMEQGTYEAVLEPIDLLPVLRRLLAEHHSLIQAKKSEVDILANGHPVQAQDTFTILGDELLCYSMLANLFRNALEASGRGQPVRISLNGPCAGQTPSGQDDGQGPLPGNGYAEVSIHNHGMVPREIQSRFFDKYVTYGKKSGTGLGTYSARLMAETQKGSIRLQSSEEEGTTLTVVLLKGEESVEYFDRR